jgi:hypothetical protein
MRYTVGWTEAALRELAAEWIQAEDRAAVTAAGNEIDRLLAISPREQGESRGGMVRVMFARPLAVEYEVIEDDCKVRVLTVWRVS